MDIRGKIEVRDLTIDEAIRLLGKASQFKQVHFLNSYNIGLALCHREYRELLAASRMNLIDGLILLRTIQFWGSTKPHNQIRGVDFLRACLLNSSSGEPYFKKHFFLGGTLETLNLLEEKCFEINPQITITSMSPPFTDLKDMDFLGITREIERSSPDIIWVGLGTPKQDFVVRYLSERTGLPTVAVGAAFDFLAGSRVESSVRMRSIGLEWLTRLLEEPKRLWRRYLIISPLSLIYPILISIKIKTIQ